MCNYWEITPELTFESLIIDYTSFLQKYKAISYFLSYFEMSSINCKFFSKIFSAYFTINMHFHIHHICFCPTTPNPPVTAGFF